MQAEQRWLFGIFEESLALAFFSINCEKNLWEADMFEYVRDPPEGSEYLSGAQKFVSKHD